MFNLIVIVGPTASGKTKFAVDMALKINGEIISGDSRQIYRGMSIGTGKDINEYTVNGVAVPYHLIDIADAGYKYNVYEFKRDFEIAVKDIVSRGKQPILCGGTGMYIEAVLRDFKMVEVPPNEELRKELEAKPIEELSKILIELKSKLGEKLHNDSDLETKKRAIRAIEIADYTLKHGDIESDKKLDFTYNIIGLDIDRELRREKISKRLVARLKEGMIEEVKGLLDSGISADDLIYYGLEYKYVTLYLTGQLSYDNMVKELEIAIHQFAKRQMTWFRGMERRGLKIDWQKVK